MHDKGAEQDTHLDVTLHEHEHERMVPSARFILLINKPELRGKTYIMLILTY